jgi:hypothetical protein
MKSGLSWLEGLALMNKNPFGGNKGFSDRKPSQEVTDFHKRDDVDSSSQAHHHTIGAKPGQAADGALLQSLITAGALGRVGDFTYNSINEETPILLLCDGASIAVADWPDLFAHFVTVYGNGYFFGGAGAFFNLPQLQGKIIGMVDPLGIAMNILGSTAGAAFTDLAHTHTTPNHSHSTPNHTHTGSVPAHNHSITGQTNSVGWAAGSGGNVSPKNADYGGHNHGGSTGNEPSAAVTINSTGAGTSGNAAPSTDSTDYASSILDFWSNSLPMHQPTLVSRIYIRAKLLP